jgi:hypothetical protein
MLQTANHTISIKRLAESLWEKTYATTVATWIFVYIEPVEDFVWTADFWESAFNVFRMFSDYPVIVWDKITDEEWTNYKVKWVRKYKSIIWTHYESVINSIYD